jgi:predicted glutamine amidotransferase
VDEKENHPETGFADMITAIAMETDYNSLSAFLMSPNELHVWRVYNDKNPEDVKLYEDYYTLYLSLRNGNAIVSSEPLDEGNWQRLPNKSFLTLKPSTNTVEIIYRQLSI